MKFKFYTAQELSSYTHLRKGEKKLGETVTCVQDPEADFFSQLQQIPARVVVVGIPEDIGVQANKGKEGTRHAWEAALKALLNTQNNSYNTGDALFIAGYLDVEEERKFLEASNLPSEENVREAGKIVMQIDSEVTYLVTQIIAAGKKLVVVGGGHNNAYGLIKGCALALNKPLNVVNFDAHTDFRRKECRHSGNGFSYAFSEGFLDRYYMLGLHENYTPKKVFEKLEKHSSRLQYVTFEEIAIHQKISFADCLTAAREHVAIDTFGIELDCDAIANVPSSAASPSGFTVEQARRFVSFMAAHKNALYLHLCEAAPDAECEREMQQVGKMLTYLLTDFLKQN